MVITQHLLDRAALVVIAGEDGLTEWSSTRDREEVARQLVKIAKAIREGTL